MASLVLATGLRAAPSCGRCPSVRSATARPCSRRTPLTVTAAAAAVALPALEPIAAGAAAAGAAAAAAAAAHHSGALVALLRLIDPHVLGATMGATFKLSLVCALVGWLIQTKQIPQNAASVLSKVGWGSWGGAAASVLFVYCLS